MPTTCGFPACKFRSRYRGHEAIGRTEETVVSQLRICSAHFKDGEKKEGDIPVPDPELDAPLSITLPPKENKANDKRRSKPFELTKTNHSNGLEDFGSYNRLNTMFMNNNAAVAAAFVNAFKCVAENQQIMPFGSTSKGNSLFSTKMDGGKNPTADSYLLNGFFDSKEATEENKTGQINCNEPVLNPFSRPTSHFNASPAEQPIASTLFGIGSTSFNTMRPLVALLDGRDCSVEMALLKDISTVAFCDAQVASEIHERVLNEAVIAFVCHSIRLQREDLQKFKCLKAIIRIGPGVEQFDLNAATELGIAICHTPVQCIEEKADTTLSLILNLYRKTFWIARSVQQSGCPQRIEQLRELASGSRRIRESQLLIIGLGQIGTAVALRAAVFGFKIGFYDPLLPEGYERTFGFTRYTVLEDALAEADCITFHCPLTPKTKRFMNMTLMKKMKRSVFIANISSDQLFVENDLLTCLKNGQIGAAAFDCYNLSPSNVFTSTLTSLSNVICTPRISWYSDSSSRELREAASRQVRQILMGDAKIPNDLQNCVNREALMALKSVIPSQPSTSSFMSPGRSLPSTEFPFNAAAYQNLYMMNANSMLNQSPISLYPHMSKLAQNTPASLTNGTTRKDTYSSTPFEDRPSSSLSSNNLSTNLQDVNDLRSSSVASNGQEAEDQKINMPDDPSDEPEAKTLKLEVDENDKCDQSTSSV